MLELQAANQYSADLNGFISSIVQLLLEFLLKKRVGLSLLGSCTGSLVAGVIASRICLVYTWPQFIIITNQNHAWKKKKLSKQSTTTIQE